MNALNPPPAVPPKKPSLVKRIASISSPTLLRIACILGLIALPLMVWSVVDPHVWPIMAALSVGQGIGTLSFVLYIVVVARDLRVWDRLRRRT
jgi:hypothetical protein